FTMGDISPRRRSQERSEAGSPRSASLIGGLVETIQLGEVLDPKFTLKRFLSTRSVVSTFSSFAERQQAVVRTRSEFRAIGAGTCGTVFEVPGTTDAFKVANNPGGHTDKLWNDFQMHLRVSEAFDTIGREKLAVHVPIIKYFVSSKDSEWWGENMDRFPQKYQSQSNLLCAERILPLAKLIRESLVDTYCPPSLVKEIKGSPSNKDCLVRIYLGKRKERISKFFQLRNFLLHLDQMEELELDTADFATHIADALAVMHWRVGIDANDVEFVLGSAPYRVANPAQIISKPPTVKQIKSMPPNTSTWASHNDDFKRQITHIWLLDFNRCEDFFLNQSGIEKLVAAFFRNDPYYPRPHGATTKDQNLWATFRNRYIATSQAHVDKEHYHLPKLFIDTVAEEQRKRMKKK
ncbi:hypothetical protein K469DRAFT_469735, partial [Zopfia rhizophila CBS 207.26]